MNSSTTWLSNSAPILVVRFSSDCGKNYVIFGSHTSVGHNNVSIYSKPCHNDNILHPLFSLEKILKMPKVTVLRIIAT